MKSKKKKKKLKYYGKQKTTIGEWSLIIAAALLTILAILTNVGCANVEVKQDYHFDCYNKNTFVGLIHKSKIAEYESSSEYVIKSDSTIDYYIVYKTERVCAKWEY